MKLHRYVDHQRLHIVTKDLISLSISVLLLFRHYISRKITFGAPSSGGVLRSACGAFIPLSCFVEEHLKACLSGHDDIALLLNGIANDAERTQKSIITS